MRELGERDDLRARRVTSRSAPDLELAIDRDLIGRERELTDLLGQIDRGRALLWGPDGIGKTALARRIAEELAPHYGTCIEVDLMGASDEPLSPAAAMTLVLRALDREGEWTKDERILSRMYRSVLATKRPILILDDARDGAQVAPLVADGGYLVLITSRQPFTLPNLYARQLGQLDPADAIGLIQELAPHVSDKTASEIAMLCGYLPLALRVAAGAFAEVHGLDPFEYIDQLRAASGEVHSATRAMNASFGLLDQSTREFWCRLSVIPADFDDETASEVGGLGRSSAKSMMWKLWRYGLVEKNERLQQYRLHHLARAYARSRLAPIERQIAEGCSALWIAYNRDDWQGMWDALGNLVGIYESLDSTKLASRQQEELRLLYARQAQVAQAITKRSG